ncbi:MAG: 6-phosphogluconolactonase, partial [Chloroflexota bacterium]
PLDVPTDHAGTQILISRTIDELLRTAATGIVDLARASVAAHGICTIALSGGGTPRSLYELLATPALATEIPWQEVHVFWGDERHVPPDHPDSNFRMANEALLSHVPIPAENIHRIPAELSNAATVAVAYADDLRRTFHLGTEDPAALPRFDLILLGMGEDGHTASLFPHSAALSERKALVAANPVPKLDTTRLTLTLPVINHAARVWFLVTGGSKADVLKAVLEGPRQPETLPSQLINPTDGELCFLLDVTAAASLSPRLHAGASAGLG